MMSGAVAHETKTIETKSAVGDERHDGCFLPSEIKEDCMEEGHLILGLKSSKHGKCGETEPPRSGVSNFRVLWLECVRSIC